MRSLFKKIWNDTRGNVLIVAGAAMPLIVGSAGLATDTIQWTLWKRQLQRAADSAAIAGVYGRMQSQVASAAVTRDITLNNHTNLALLPGTPAVTLPADTSDYTNAVQVILRSQKKLTFSSMFLATPPVITATAVAGVIQTGTYCVVSLETGNVTGITATGSTSVALGCGMITNSTSLSAAVAAGSSSVSASPIAAVGGIQSSNNFASGTQLLPFTLAEADPFASVVPALPASCTSALNVGPGETVDLSASSSACYTSITVKGTLKLPAGPLYVNGGDVKINSGADVSGTASTIVLSNNSASTTAPIGTIDINGNATIKLVAPTSGTYNGLLVYQDRRATDASATGGASSPNGINGGAGSVLEGAFYFPKQQVTMNGNASMDTKCMQLVARRVYFSGSSSITNVCPATRGAGGFRGSHVRLVG